MNTESSSIAVNKDRPWPGPAPYTEQTSPFFFGREQEAEVLSRLVQASVVSVLYGASGLGKTSLLCAGLFPRLRAEDFLPIYIRLKGEASSDLDSQVFAALERESKERRISCKERQSLTACPLWEYFYHVETEFWGPRNEYLTPVLVFDQFEELLRVPPDKSNWNTFIQELGDLIEGRVPTAVRAKFQEQPDLRRCFDATRQNFRVLFSFREDFLPHFEMLRGNIPSIVYHRSRLLPMTQSQARDAICKPGEGILASGGADAILQVAAGQRLRTVTEELPASSDGNIEPFILSLICWELNERRLQAGDTQITSAMVQRSSGEILDSFYRRTMKDQLNMIDFVEGQLVDEEGFRRSVSRRDVLIKHGLNEEELKHLEDARLTRQEEHLGIPHVELIHDVFAAVVKRNRDARQKKRVADADDLIAFLLSYLKEKLQSLGLLELLDSIFQKVEDYFASLPRHEQQKERTLANQATLYACQGESSYVRDWLERAETAFEQCCDMRAELLSRDPSNPQYKYDLVEALGWLGDVCYSQGELDRASKHYDECFQYATELVELSPDKTDWQKLYGSVLLKKGDLYRAIGNLNAAMRNYQEYSAIYRRLVQQNPVNAEWQRELGKAWNRLGHVENDRRNLEAALQNYQENLDICRRLAQQDPANAGWQRDLAVACNDIGRVEEAWGNLETALQNYQDYLAICRRLAQQASANSDWQHDLAIALICVGEVYEKIQESKALNPYQEAKTILRRLVKLSPDNAGWQEDLATVTSMLARLKRRLNRLKKASEQKQGE